MDFVVIANAWSAARDNPTSKHQLAIELTRQGHRVLWVEGAGMRTPSVASGRDRSAIVSKLRMACAGLRQAEGGISVLTPLLVPFPALRQARRFNGFLCAGLAARWCRKLGFRDPILINYVPVLVDAMLFWRGCEGARMGKSAGRSVSVIYHCVDRWDAFAMYDSALMAVLDEGCCRAADLVIASSEDLKERCLRFNSRTQLVSHGVDHAHFAKALDVKGDVLPADLPRGKVAGFIGLLSEWVDQDLLVRLARELPDCHFVLIGKADVPVDRLQGLANVHLMGPRPFSVLPAYVAGFDVGLIPFVVNSLTRAVNPIKLREMLAAGCPVVATNLPEVAAAGVRGAVVAKDHAEFVALVKNAIENKLVQSQRQAISGEVEAEGWNGKVNHILSLIEC